MTTETMENVRTAVVFLKDLAVLLEQNDLKHGMNTNDTQRNMCNAADAISALCDRHERAVRLLERVSDIEDYAQLASVASDIRTFIAEQEPDNV